MVVYALGSNFIDNLVMRIKFILLSKTVCLKNIFVDMERRWGSDHKSPRYLFWNMMNSIPRKEFTSVLAANICLIFSELVDNCFKDIYL